METHSFLPFLLVLASNFVENTSGSLSPKFTSTLKATSKAVYSQMETKIIPGVSGPQAFIKRNIKLFNLSQKAIGKAAIVCRQKQCSKMKVSTILRSESKPAEDRQEAKRNGSRVVCASIRQATPGFTAFKIQEGNCILVDGRNLVAPKPGEEIEMITFSDAYPAISGGWSPWSLSSATCSVSCGLGSLISTRECNNPLPQSNGDYCQGNNTNPQNHPCNEQKCLGSVLEFPSLHGIWGETEICPGPHGFVTSMKTRAQPPQGGSADDAGMTEINLFCDDGSLLRSAYDLTGTMGATRSCPLGYNAAKVIMEAKNYDDTGANCLELFCISDETWHKSECTDWGDYSSQSCSDDERICGLKTKVHNQVPNELSGVNDVHLTCCSGYP